MSSFVKIKKEDSPEINGVKTSIRNGKIVSTGSDSLDFVIGGGIEISSLFLIGEDKYGRHANIMTKLFLAEGFLHQHDIYCVNLDDDPRKMMKEIPPGTENKQESTTEGNNNDLRIAFRYQALPKLDSEQRGQLSSISYDLSKKVEAELVEKRENIKYFSFADIKKPQTPFEGILEDLQILASENRKNLLRICISSLGSPLWYSETFPTDVLMFLTNLKSFVRYNPNMVCLFTMPLHLINLIDAQLVFKIRRLVDVNINLESFDNVDKQTNAVFKQYHGLLHIKKLQTITALQSHKPEAFDLAFKLKQHRFAVEKLHLPPELQDGNEAVDRPRMSCSTSGGGKALDF